MQIEAKQFYGILNDHPVSQGLFKDFKPGEIYLFEITVFVDDVLQGNICRITIFDQKSGIHRTANLPSSCLDNLYIPFTSPAAKALFGGPGSKFD